PMAGEISAGWDRAAASGGTSPGGRRAPKRTHTYNDEAAGSSPAMPTSHRLTSAFGEPVDRAPKPSRLHHAQTMSHGGARAHRCPRTISGRASSGLVAFKRYDDLMGS